MAYRDQESSIHEASQPLNASARCSCFPRAIRFSWWQKLRAKTTPSSPTAATANDKWWAKGITALKKIREWSELVAGPKWKTFIRRFNRKGSNRAAKFQYDPLSYALNFDDGQGYNGDFDGAEGVQNFSSRYASISGNPNQL